MPTPLRPEDSSFEIDVQPDEGNFFYRLGCGVRRWATALLPAPRREITNPVAYTKSPVIRAILEGRIREDDGAITIDDGREGKPDPAGDPEITDPGQSRVTRPFLRAFNDPGDSGSEFEIDLEGVIPGFKFVGQVFDAEARRAAFASYPAALTKARDILDNLLHEATPNDPQLRKFHEIKTTLVRAYHAYARVTAALTEKKEPLRNPEAVLAWDECALDTVNLPLAEGVRDPLSPQQKEFYRFFVEIAVLFDILLDDAGETLKAKRLSKFVQNFSTQRLIHHNTDSVDSFEGYGDLSGHEQAYAKLVEALTNLLDRAIDALCDLDNMQEGEHKVQIMKMRALMEEDRRDLVRMITFSTELDDMIHDVEGARDSIQRVFEGGDEGRVITRDRLPTRAEMNEYTQQNIFLRFMVMGRHIQLWRNMTPKERSKVNFEPLQKEMEAYGQKLNSLGNMGNDDGSLPKEVREGTFANSILAKALEDGDITISDLFMAQKALNKMPEKKAIGLLSDILNEYYSNVTYVNWSAIRANHSNGPNAQTVIDLMETLFDQEGAFINCLTVWDDELGELSKNTTEMRKLYNIDRHTEIMVEFLLRYVQASLLKLKL